MNKSTKFLVAAALATISADAISSSAQAAVIASIGFDGRTIFPTTPPSGAQLLTSAQMSTGYIAEVGTGTMYGIHTLTSSVWSYPAGNGSTTAMSSFGWSLGAGAESYWEFEFPTDDFENIIVNFDQVGSNTGPRFWKAQYKVGTGGAYTDFATYAISNVAWSTAVATPASNYNLDLSAVSAIEDVAGQNVFVRLLVDGTQQIGTNSTAVFSTGGTSRIDNVLISGSPIPEPTTVGLLTAAASALLASRRRQRAE